MTDTPLTAARGLRELIIENRDATERDRRLPPAVVEALIGSRLCRMALPNDDGSPETPPLAAFEAYEELAAAEASVAWIAWNNSLVCLFARYLSPEVREAVFGEPKNLFANSTRPSGRAVADGEGYVVTGRWSLVSGCLHAQWIPVLCLVEKNGQIEMLAPGMPHMRMVVVPRKRYEILDTWYVGGLRGTGSHDVVLENERVPADRSFAPFVDATRIDSRLGRVPITVTMAAACASLCVGVARAALDALIELGRARVTPGPEPDMRDRANVQAVVSRNGSLLSALRAELHATYAALWEGLETNESASLEHIADVWGAAIVTALECRSIVDETHAAAGTAAIYTSSPIERAQRDIHAVLQHMVLQPRWLEEVGRVRLGLEPVDPLFAA